MLTSVLCMKAHYLYYIGVIILLLNLSFQQAMVFISYSFMNDHFVPLVGHLGVSKMLDLLQQYVWWPKMQ